MDSEEEKKPKTKGKQKRKSTAAKKGNKKPKKAKPEPQRITDRDELEKLWDAKEALEKYGSYTFKILSWNVAGLRAVMKNHPDALPDLATKHDIDVICLQETKLQEAHLTDPKLKIKGHLLEKEGYESHFSCSKTKKGYSGTAVFIKKRKTSKPNNGERKESTPGKKKQMTLGSFLKSDKADDGDSSHTATSSTFGGIDVSDLIPVAVSNELGDETHDSEGRLICVDFPRFSLVNVYVPNSGAKLDRLDYRTESWDVDFLNFMQQKEKDRGVPVIWLGDLNVARTWQDTWNEGAPHLKKSAGTTPQERESFQKQLDANGGSFVDAFRHLHRDKKGVYSYWSQRASNREPNKGLRLDYFICSKKLLDDEEQNKILVRDTYMLPDQMGSDHCPLVLELELRK